MKLSTEDRSLLALIVRSSDVGDGWRNVSKTLWNVVSNFKHKELVEYGDHKVRLTQEGEIVAKWL